MCTAAYRRAPRSEELPTEGPRVIDKLASDARTAIGDVADGSTILIAGFGDAGRPDHLVEDGLRASGARHLTVVSNNAGRETHSLGGLIHDGAVDRLICSFPTGQGSWAFRERLDRGEIEMELVPQGQLVERLRAAGSGLLGFYTRAPLGTAFVRDEEIVDIEGVPAQFHLPLRGDLALLSGAVADRWGNVVCRRAARNFNPVMAMAATRTVVEVERIVEVGELDPDHIHIPGVLVDAVVVRVPSSGQEDADR